MQTGLDCKPTNQLTSSVATENSNPEQKDDQSASDMQKKTSDVEAVIFLLLPLPYVAFPLPTF